MEELRKNEFWKRKLRTVMKVRDTDKDGLITTSDYKLVVERYKDIGASKEHLEKIEKIYCELWKSGGIANDNTALTYEQFTADIGGSGGYTMEHSKIFTAQFEIVDSNGNGEISFKEWLDHYTALGIDTVHARASFDAMDTNGDGIVSKEEFIAYAKEFFLTAEDKLNSSILFGPLID